MNRLLIVYHSLTGGARQMAQAAGAGAAHEPQIVVQFETAAQATPGALLEAQGYLFGTRHFLICTGPSGGSDFETK